MVFYAGYCSNGFPGDAHTRHRDPLNLRVMPFQQSRSQFRWDPEKSRPP